MCHFSIGNKLMVDEGFALDFKRWVKLLSRQSLGME
jgi:hypothetical protein